MTYFDEVMADAPVAYYRCNEATTADPRTIALVDSSGNGRNGTMGLNAYNPPVNNIDSVPSLLAYGGDTALDLTAANNELLESGALPALNNNVTVELWVDTTGVVSSGGSAVLWRDVHASTGWFLGVYAANVTIRISGTTYTTTYPSANLKDGEPHHTVVTVDASTVRLYVDGVEVWNGARTASALAVTSPLRVGRNGTASQYTSLIADEWAIYDTTLSAVRVQAHYDAANTAPPPPPPVSSPLSSLLAESIPEVCYGGLLMANPSTVQDPLTIEVLASAYARPPVVFTLDGDTLTCADDLWFVGIPPGTSVAAIGIFDEALNGNLRFAVLLPEIKHFTLGGTLKYEGLTLTLPSP